jgi:hypothetical protein
VLLDWRENGKRRRRINRIYKTVIFPQIDRYVYSISQDSVPEFGANMAQVTLGKLFSGFPQKRKSDGEHISL